MNIFIHVGVLKSGTTTLQNALFGRHPEINALAKPYSDGTLDPGVVKALRKADNHDYDHTATKQHLHAALDNLARANVLSDETLCSGPMPSITAIRLRDIFPNVRIMLTIRNQLTAIPSVYANHARQLKNVPGRWNGRYVSFEEWFEFVSSRPGESYLAVIDYWRLYQIYAKVFGPEQVGVFAVEEMFKSLDRFADRLGKFLGLDSASIRSQLSSQRHNSRDHSGTVMLQAIRSRYFHGGSLLAYVPFRQTIRKSLQAWAMSTRPAQIILTDAQRAWICERYSPGNANLSTAINLSLLEWDYPMPDKATKAACPAPSDDCS
jgi:hypothetical protein